MNYDCVICGAGPSGICAAIAYKRLSKNVLLIEDSGLIGGTNILSLVGPLMTFHNLGKQVITGIADEIVNRLTINNGSLGHINDPLGFCDTVTPIDTESLKKLYFDYISELDIDLLLHTKVIGCEKENDKITSIKVVNKEGITDINATYFIDCTGDGDLAFFAKEDYVLGRESDHLCQPMTMPFVVGNVDFDKLRNEMKNNPSNFVLRDDYDYKYIGISGFFDEVKKAKENGTFNVNRDRVLLFENVKNNSVTVNMTRVIMLNPLKGQDLTKAEIIGRNQVYECFDFLKNNIPGFENSYILETPSQIGIRESRHIVCEYMLQKEDVWENRKFDDAICVSAFPMDIHSPVGAALELDEQLPNNLAFEIPLRSILPKKTKNLIVAGRMIGATHEAAASLRVSPICMALGEVAGTIMALCANNKIEIRELKYQVLKDQLLKNNYNMEY